jgi:photosystem II stability/assembly factor-like uncharacterized protein
MRRPFACFLRFAVRQPLGIGAVFCGLLGPALLAAQSVPGIEALAARNIGPAGMSGRVASVAVVHADPTRMFVGGATGGVFRSVDGGVTWDPVFDDQPVLGVGAIAVFQPNPDLVWVGTGEGNPRNSAGVGDGLFRSRDGGDTWERVGLEGSERIHRILTHPTDPDVVWVGVMGPAWSDGAIRGVYRTTDGGDSWQRVLYVDEGTGVADLVLDPSNPDKLFAALWDFRRTPDFFRSGGPGSGLYLTHDGGDSWRRLGVEHGMPEGELGRIGLAIAPSDPEIVYALVEATKNVLLRSDNGGRTFDVVTDRPDVNPRPFYYADLRVDPGNPDRLYSLHSSMQVSQDQGRTFRTVVSSGILHGDVHELWIDPADGRHMIMGNDGGIGISYDGGTHWRFVENLTLAQFYHISLDDAVPFNVYGGLQDNGSWYGPSDVWESKGIFNAHWRRVGGGDGFSVLDDPTDPRFGFSMSQGGNLQRFDRTTGARVGIQPLPGDGPPLRFNWNAALALDPLDPSTLYLGSQFVHRTRDRGASWETVSPDLTTNDPQKQRQDVSGGLTLDATGAENHTTLIDISPSPVAAGMIWAGSDDGNVHLTRDGGATWLNTVVAMEGAPATGWVADIEPSPHDAESAWVVFDEHRRGDGTPYLFRTDDAGASWTRLGEEIGGFLHAVEQDPVEPNLVFAGSEFGLWMSMDRGESWARVPHVPAVPIRDIEVHARDGDLVLGTHGRGIWVIDAIHALREVAARGSLPDEDVHLFETPPSLLHATAEGIGYRSTGMAMWQGATRPYGALLTFWAGPTASGSADVEIRAESGGRVAAMTTPVRPGLNRVVWDLVAIAPDSSTGLADGAEVLPARYVASVRLNGTVAERALIVDPDPRLPAPDLRAARTRLAALREAGARSGLMEQAERRLTDLRASLVRIRGRLSDADLSTRVRALDTQLEALQRRLFLGPECQGICGGETLAGPIGGATSMLRSGTGPLTPLERQAIGASEDALAAVLGEVNAALAGPVSELSTALAGAALTPLLDLRPLVWGGPARP